jgi:hypothetical protein
MNEGRMMEEGDDVGLLGCELDAETREGCD